MPKTESIVPTYHEQVKPDLIRDIHHAVATLPDNYLRMIEAGETYSMYGSMNVPIAEDLQANHRDAFAAFSTNRDGNAHVYVVIEDQTGEITVDAAISQFIFGFNRVFVGTRDELRQLVLDPNTVIINTRSRNNPPEAFQRTWGDNSRPYGTRRR